MRKEEVEGGGSVGQREARGKKKKQEAGSETRAPETNNPGWIGVRDSWIVRKRERDGRVRGRVDAAIVRATRHDADSDEWYRETSRDGSRARRGARARADRIRERIAGIG